MLATLQAKLIAAGICLLVGALAGGIPAWRITADIKDAAIERMRAADAEAEQARLKQAAEESAKALAVQQQSLAESNARITELTADRQHASALLTTLNDRIAHAPTGTGNCGPLRAAADGLR